eukprot:g55970.t1
MDIDRDNEIVTCEDNRIVSTIRANDLSNVLEREKIKISGWVPSFPSHFKTYFVIGASPCLFRDLESIAVCSGSFTFPRGEFHGSESKEERVNN